MQRILSDARARTLLAGGKPIGVGGVDGLRLFPSAERKGKERKGQGRYELRFISPKTHERRDMGLGT